MKISVHYRSHEIEDKVKFYNNKSNIKTAEIPD